MKRETKLGMITEVIYLLAVIGIVSLLLRLEVIPAEKSWIYICFFLFLIDPLREGYWINFRLFTWRNWKKYLLHTLVLVAILVFIEVLFF